jgi:hypothetical protein
MTEVNAELWANATRTRIKVRNVGVRFFMANLLPAFVRIDRACRFWRDLLQV